MRNRLYSYRAQGKFHMLQVPLLERNLDQTHSLPLESLPESQEATETPSGNNDPSGSRFWELVLGA